MFGGGRGGRSRAPGVLRQATQQADLYRALEFGAAGGRVVEGSHQRGDEAVEIQAGEEVGVIPGGLELASQQAQIQRGLRAGGKEQRQLLLHSPALQEGRKQARVVVGQVGPQGQGGYRPGQGLFQCLLQGLLSRLWRKGAGRPPANRLEEAVGQVLGPAFQNVRAQRRQKCLRLRG